MIFARFLANDRLVIGFSLAILGITALLVAGNLLLRLADDRPTRQATADTVEQAS